MALTEQELQLALKGYPVKTSNGYPVDRIKIIGNRLVGYTHSSSDYAFWHLNGVHVGNNRLNLHLDHEEARRINFVPQPEFGDLVQVRHDGVWQDEPLPFIKFNSDSYPICADSGHEFNIGSNFTPVIYDQWRWPSTSPYKISHDRYEVLKSGEPVEVSEEKMKQIKDILNENE